MLPSENHRQRMTRSTEEGEWAPRCLLLACVYIPPTPPPPHPGLGAELNAGCVVSFDCPKSQ